MGFPSQANGLGSEPGRVSSTLDSLWKLILNHDPLIEKFLYDYLR